MKIHHRKEKGRMVKAITQGERGGMYPSLKKREKGRKQRGKKDKNEREKNQEVLQKAIKKELKLHKKEERLA